MDNVVPTRLKEKLSEARRSVQALRLNITIQENMVGGTVVLNSQVGMGTTIYVNIPL